MYIIVVGGGNVGTQLTKRLIARKHEVLLLEKDARQATKLASALGEAYVQAGDGCELHVQRAAGFNRADVVVAATGEDEDNLVVCQLAKHKWNVDRVLARVNDPGHEEIFRELGIDETVSATRLIFNLIDQQLETDDLVPIGALHRGSLEVVESILSSRSPVLGRKVRELALPPGTFFVYVQRDGVGSVVDGDTELRADDLLVALVPVAHAEDLRAVLSADG